MANTVQDYYMANTVGITSGVFYCMQSTFLCYQELLFDFRFFSELSSQDVLLWTENRNILSSFNISCGGDGMQSMLHCPVHIL